ncbi:MAG: enoyl-CoA hydratase/isomerase family protein [Xanthomonadales bacterium]
MLEIHDHGEIREIRLARPPANALNGELVNALADALKSAGAEAGAAVVSADGRMFCAGLDVPELLRLERTRFAGLWCDFVDLMQTIATLPVPVVFAMQGHAMAGGLLLALFSDYRILPRGPFKTGLNEVRVGLVAPTPVHRALVRLVGPNVAARMLVSGAVVPAEEALAIGLVDELADTPSDVVPAALAWCEQHLALPRHAMSLSRRMVRADLHRIFDDYDARENDSWVDLWFSEATQATLRKLAASLGK